MPDAAILSSEHEKVADIIGEAVLPEVQGLFTDRELGLRAIDALARAGYKIEPLNGYLQTCICYDYKPGSLTGGIKCPRHGQRM